MRWPFKRKRQQPETELRLLRDDELEQNFKHVLTMEERARRRANRSRPMLTVALGVSMLGNLGLIYAIDMLTPTLRLVPIAISQRVDGTFTAEPLVSMLPADTQDATLRSTLYHYVSFREGYSADSARFRYYAVNAMSSKPVAAEYDDWFNCCTDPEGPQTLYSKNDGQVVIEPDKADFSDNDPNVYVVTYWKTVIVPGQPSVRTHWTSWVHYRHVTGVSYYDLVWDINAASITVTGYPKPMQIGKPET